MGLMSITANANDDELNCVKPPVTDRYDYVGCLNRQGLALVGGVIKTPLMDLPNPLGIVDRFGNVILDTQYYDIQFPHDWKTAYEGDELSDLPILVTKRDLNNNPIFGNLGVQEEYGLVNKTGKFIVPLNTYHLISTTFDDDIFIVSNNDKWGFIDATGKEIIPLIYDYASSFKDGFGVVSFNGNFGMIDRNNNTVIPFEFCDIEVLSNQLIAVQKTKEGKYALMNNKGKPLGDFSYDFIHSLYYGDTFSVKRNGLYGIIDNTGKIIIPINYEAIDVNLDLSFETRKVHFNVTIDNKEQIIGTQLPIFPD